MKIDFIKDVQEGGPENVSENERYDIEKLRMAKDAIKAGDTRKALILIDECIGNEGREESSSKSMFKEKLMQAMK